MSHTRDPAFIDIDSEAGNSVGNEGGGSFVSGSSARTEGVGASAAPASSDRISDDKLRAWYDELVETNSRHFARVQELEHVVGQLEASAAVLEGAVRERDAAIECLKAEIRDIFANRCDLVAQRAAKLLGGAHPPDFGRLAARLERAVEDAKRAQDWIHRSEHALANRGGEG